MTTGPHAQTLSFLSCSSYCSPFYHSVCDPLVERLDLSLCLSNTQYAEPHSFYSTTSIDHMFSCILRATDREAILHGHPHFLRFLWTTTAFESNRHINFLTCGIVFTLHITLQTFSFELIPCALSFLCSFNWWITDFTVTRPSLACGDIIRSLLTSVLSGMFLMKFVSISLKLPWITSSSNSRFFPINSWTLVFGVYPFWLGHSTIYPGLLTTYGLVLGYMGPKTWHRTSAPET